MIGTLSWSVRIDDETDMCARYVFVCSRHEKKPLHRFGMELLPYKHIFRIRGAWAFSNWCLRFPLRVLLFLLRVRRFSKRVWCFLKIGGSYFQMLAAH